MCRSYRTLLHTTQGQEIKFTSKSITMIDPVIGWFEVVQYADKIDISVANLVETTWMSRYTRPIDITYDQGK